MKPMPSPFKSRSFVRHRTWSRNIHHNLTQYAWRNQEKNRKTQSIECQLIDRVLKTKPACIHKIALPQSSDLFLFLDPPDYTTLFTSKNLRSHQTWNTDSPMTTLRMKMFHHLTRLLVLSAVFRWVRSRTTMYDCSSLTWERTSESLRTISYVMSARGPKIPS